MGFQHAITLIHLKLNLFGERKTEIIIRAINHKTDFKYQLSKKAQFSQCMA